MPRGNDSQSALVDLQGEYGSGVSNAQLLIDSARALITPELRAANLKKREVDDDGKVLKPKVSDVQKKVGDGGTVLSTAVRGGYVVAVVEAESGRTYKDVWPASEFSVDGASEPRKIDESEDEQATRENVRATLKEVSEASQREREANEKAEEARREHLEKAQKATQDSGSSSSSSSSSGSGNKS